MDEGTRVLAKTAIQRARRLLSSPSRWTKGAEAKDQYGVPVGEKSPEACQWCLRGALRAVSINGDYEPARKAVESVLTEKGFTGLPHFNDSYNTKYHQVVQVLDEADARL